MLKGAKNQEILKTSLARLSTYGILSRWSEDDIRQFLTDAIILRSFGL